MKEFYSKPVVQVEEFKSLDVVTTSYIEENNGEDD